MKLELVPPHKQNKVVLLLKFQIKDGLVFLTVYVIHQITCFSNLKGLATKEAFTRWMMF